MRYRLRTLFVVVSVSAVLLALASALLTILGQTKITRAPDGRQAIRQLHAADAITVRLFVDGRDRECLLDQEAATELRSWLTTAIRDTRPAKRIALGRIELGVGEQDAWFVLQMNDFEVSVQTSHGTWRGLDRGVLERLVKACERE